jgi:hypothetical protein
LRIRKAKKTLAKLRSLPAEVHKLPKLRKDGTIGPYLLPGKTAAAVRILAAQKANLVAVVNGRRSRIGEKESPS